MAQKVPSYAVFCRVEALEDTAVFERLLPLADRERRKKIGLLRRQRDRALSLAAGLLLGHCLERWGIAGAVTFDASGRPVAPGEAYVSVTHSYPYAAAVISRAPCGVDVERWRENMEPIVRRWYLAREQAYCRESVHGSMDIWCRKECWIKCFGIRGPGEIDTFAVPPGYGYTQVPLEGHSFQILTLGPVQGPEELRLEERLPFGEREAFGGRRNREE